MIENAKRLIPLMGLLAATMGCALSPPPLTAIKANDVERIPLKLGFYPILSAPAPVYVRVPRGPYPAGPRGFTTTAVIPGETQKSVEGQQSGEAPQGGEAPQAEARQGVEVKRLGDNVVIVPPTRSDLAITEESEIMGGLITARLATLGFSLKELPVEYLSRGEGSESSEGGNGFAISMNLMNQLREQYGIDAIVMGTAFFFIEQLPQRPYPEKNVVSVHLKIVDTKTLDILAQVIMPYDSNGADLNDVAQDVANTIGRLAGVAIE